MKWRRECDIHRLVDRRGYTRALIYNDQADGLYQCVGPLGTTEPPEECSNRSLAKLKREAVEKVRERGY